MRSPSDMRRRCVLPCSLLLLLVTAGSSGAAAEKRKNRPRTIPYRFVDPLEMKLTAPHSFDLQTDMYLRGLQEARVHPAGQYPRAFSPPGLPNPQPFFGGVVHPPKSFTSGSSFPNLAPQPGAQPRSAPGGPVNVAPGTKPPHVLSSVQPVTNTHKILEGPYLVDAEEDTSVFPLTSSIRLLEDNEKLHPSVESSVLPIKTTHHIVEGRSKYTPPVYTPSLNKAADPYRTTHNLFKEADLAYFLSNSEKGVQQTPTSQPKSSLPEPDSPLYFDSVKVQNAGKLSKPVLGFGDIKEFSSPHAGFESSFQHQKNPRSILSTSKLQDSSLKFFEPHDLSLSSPTKSDISAPLKSVDSFTTQAPYSSPLERNRAHGPKKSSRNPFDSLEPQHQSYAPSASSPESKDPAFFETANPYGKHPTPGKLYHSLLTAQKQIDSLLETYSPHDDLKSFENPKGFQSQGYAPIKQAKLEHPFVSSEYHDGSLEHYDVRDLNRKPNSKSQFSQPLGHPQFKDKITGNEHNLDNKEIFNAQFAEVKPDPKFQDAHQLRAFRRPPNGPYDFKLSSGSDHSLQPHKPKRHGYETNDGFIYNYDSPSFGPHETPRKIHQKPKEIKPLKPVYAPEYKKEVHRERSESLLKKPPVGKSFKDFSRIPGIPGKDYPVLNEVPYTSFSCSNVPHRPGIYANVEAHCQAYHVCHDDRYGEQGAAFLCSNGTLFNQVTFSCDWWYKVDCKDSTEFYDLNADPRFNPYYKKTDYEAKEGTVDRKSAHESFKQDERQRDRFMKSENTAQPMVPRNPSRYEENVDFSVREGPTSNYARESQSSKWPHLGSSSFSRTRSRDSHDFRKRSNDKSSPTKPVSNSSRGSTRSISRIKSSSRPEE